MCLDGLSMESDGNENYRFERGSEMLARIVIVVGIVTAVFGSGHTVRCGAGEKGLEEGAKEFGLKIQAMQMMLSKNGACDVDLRTQKRLEIADWTGLGIALGIACKQWVSFSIFKRMLLSGHDRPWMPFQTHLLGIISYTLLLSASAMEELILTSWAVLVPVSASRRPLLRSQSLRVRRQKLLLLVSVLFGLVLMLLRLLLPFLRRH